MVGRAGWLVVGVVLVAITIGAFVYEYSRISPPGYLPPNSIEYTKEYQITLDQKAWTKREKSLLLWLKTIKELAPALEFQFKEMEEKVYEQRYPHIKGDKRCNANVNLHARVRNYVHFGGEERSYLTSTVQLKQSGYEWEVCDLPFWPAEEFLPLAVQKCEQDIHPCFQKHSRITKVSFPDFRPSETCADLLQIFPWAFPALQSKALHNPTAQTKGSQYWLAYEYSGRVNGTKWSMAFTWEYKDEKSALRGRTKPRSGEFSFRIHAQEIRQGFSASGWNEEVGRMVEEMYFNLVLLFDKFPEHILCANDFFSQQRHA